MTRRVGVAVYIALLAWFAAAWLVTSSAAALGAALLLFFLPVLSLVWNLLVRKRMTAQITVGTFAEKNETLRGTLCVRCGRLFLPAGRLSAALDAHNELTDEPAHIPITLSPDGGNYAASFTFSSEHCGRIRFSVASLRLWDVFSLLPLSVPCDASARCTVLPRTFPVDIADPALPNATAEADEYLPRGGGNDFTEVYQLRDYVPGDDVRGIHWLLSSKLDTPVYREPALAVQRSLLLFWDKTDAEADVTDALAEAVFSVAQALSERGLPFTLAYVRKEMLQEADIRDMDTLSGVLPLLLRGGQRTAQPDVSAYGRTLWFTSTGEAPEGNGVTTLLCTKKPSDAPCDVVFTPQTLTETLHRLDWNYER